jgi:hypothetical protein
MGLALPSERGIDPARIEEYWDWVAVALFLLVGVELLTTLAAARVVGLGVLANNLAVIVLWESLL